MKRKIIQISALGATLPRLYALCDDGTIWLRSLGEWSEVDGIPQPEEAGEPVPATGHRILVQGEIIKEGDFCEGFDVTPYQIGRIVSEYGLGRYTRPIK